jgi:SPP1 gp7 family putative phage head morphogenesis protein
MAKLKFTQKQIEKLLEDVHTGIINPLNLSNEYYLAVAEYLEKGIYSGFKNALSDIKFGTPDYELLKELRDNIYMFSAAKDFQMVKEMSAALVDEQGNVKSFKDFKEDARSIYTTYTGGTDEDGFKEGWLQTEYTTAIDCAASAKEWSRVEQSKKLFPYLRYIATSDDLVCEICGPLDGICLPVDSPFWDDNLGPNHFNCRCYTEQLELEEGQDKETDETDVEERTASSQETKNDLFNFNAGKDRVIFKSEGEGKHPYFEVEKGYKKFAEENFGLPLPEDE